MRRTRRKATAKRRAGQYEYKIDVLPQRFILLFFIEFCF